MRAHGADVVPVILRCDWPGCGKEAPAVWLASGRLERDAGWFIMPGIAWVACCMDHVRGLGAGPNATPSEERDP